MLQITELMVCNNNILKDNITIQSGPKSETASMTGNLTMWDVIVDDVHVSVLGVFCTGNI